jgi:hypothetical protein
MLNICSYWGQIVLARHTDQLDQFSHLPKQIHRLTLKKTNQESQILPICLTFNESLILAHQDVKQEKKLHFLVQCSNSTCNVISRTIQIIKVINANIWKDWELDNSPEELPRFSWTMEELERRKCSYQATGWMYIFPQKRRECGTQWIKVLIMTS